MIIVIYRYKTYIRCLDEYKLPQKIQDSLFKKSGPHMWATQVHELNTSIYKSKQQQYCNQLRKTWRIVSIHFQNNTLFFLIKNDTFVSNSVWQSRTNLSLCFHLEVIRNCTYNQVSVYRPCRCRKLCMQQLPEATE
jgi:hypothetical protein